MTGYARKSEFNLTMSFKISDKQLLKKYNQLWKRIEKLLEIKFDSKPVYGDDEKYMKTKIKTYGVSVITNFHSKKMSKGKTACKCLSIIMLDSDIEAKKKYYPQMLLEECKYEQERIKIENLLMMVQKEENLMNLIVKQNLIMIMINNLLKVKKAF